MRSARSVYRVDAMRRIGEFDARREAMHDDALARALRGG
jgi:hypothetical protein